jgi:Tfp pilus assembly protein PilX
MTTIRRRAASSGAAGGGQESLAMRIRGTSQNGMRRGVALTLVIFVVLGVVVLGTAMLYSNTQRALSSQRCADGRRALFLAESGLVRARWRLGQSDTSSAGFWTGTTGAQLDGTGDYYNITVTCSDGKYTITSTGYVLDEHGEVVARQRLVATVPACSEWDAGKAVFSESSLTVAPVAVVVGDVYADDSVINNGAISGDVLSRSFVGGTGTIGGTTTQWWSGQIVGPDVQPGYYEAYELNEVTYNAAHFYDKDWKADNPRNDGGAITGSNIRGVVFCDHDEADPSKPDLIIKNDVNFQGTLIIQGNLELEGDNITLRGEPGFPALIITGDVILHGSNKHRTIHGSVVVGGWVRQDGDNQDSTLTINGALIFKDGGTFSPLLSEGSVTVNYDSPKGRIRELANETAGPAAGPLQWQPRGTWEFWDNVPDDPAVPPA